MVFFESRKRIDAVAVILCISILAVVLGEFTATCTSIEEVKRRTESERSIRIRKDQAKRSLLDQRARLRSIRRFKPNEGAKGGLMPQVFFEEEHNDNEEIESESDRIVEGRSQHSTKKSKKSKVDKKTRKEKKSKKEKAKKNEHGGRMHAAVNSEEDDDDEHASGKASSFDGRGIISNNRPHSSLDNDRDEDIDIVVVNTTQIDEMSASEDGELVEKLRTIQLSHPEIMNDCVSYDSTMNQTVLFMSECSSTARNSRHPDHWEILPSTMDTNTTGQFHLRHEETQLCIPVNPETPELPFDCVRYFGMNEVLADSFNGLIECDSGFAAVFGILPSSNSLYLANTGCALNTESSEQEVIFMSYFNTIADRKVLVWGEEMLLELDSAIDDYQLENKWVFVDVDLLDRYEGVAVSRSEWSF